MDPDDTDNESKMSRREAEIQKMFEALEKRARKRTDYLLAEGFIETTDVPGVYKYTPEGLVLVHQHYKKLRDEGML